MVTETLRATTLKLDIHDCSRWPQLKDAWSELVEAAECCSAFLTRPWIDSWIETFGRRLEFSILIWKHEEQPVGGCLLVKSKPVVGLVPISRVTLNASGEPFEDTPYSEYSDLICRRGWETPVAESLVEYLRTQHWNEVVLGGFVAGPAYEVLKKGFRDVELDEILHTSWYVDLAALRRAGARYESALGHTMRKRLRQNAKYHSALGPVRLEFASDTAGAISMLEELAELSRRRWAMQGRRCIFSSSAFMTFHRKFITTGFSDGLIQMIRVAAGEQTIGLIYNLVHRGKVYFYQCGYQYGEDKRLSPGTWALSHVIEHCQDAGFDEFDLLSGGSGYKRWLSTGSRPLAWTTFRRPGVRSQLIRWLRKAKTAIS